MLPSMQDELAKVFGLLGKNTFFIGEIAWH
jgi:hypothetical protein